MIYVDEVFEAMPRNAQARSHGTRWSHMITDGDLEELHAMAAKLGLRRSYFQSDSFPHYDLVPSKRALAITFGAVSLPWREMVAKMKELREARKAI
jgi:hypothetical protein